LEKALCCFGIAACLHEKFENVSILVDRAPQTLLLATDRDRDLIQVPLVVRPRTIPANAIREVSTKTIDPQPDRFPADNHTPYSL
jgi:hypothetical protein